MLACSKTMFGRSQALHFMKSLHGDSVVTFNTEAEVVISEEQNVSF